MAKLIKVNGDIIEVKPKKDKFTLKEINEMIGEYVYPFFNYEHWIFINNFIKPTTKNHNKEASELLQFHISGDCLVAVESELLPIFLISQDFFTIIEDVMGKYIDELNKIFDIMDEDMEDDDEDEDDEGDLIMKDDETVDKTEIQKQRFEYLMEESYKNLIELNISFKDILKRFIIFRSATKFIEIDNDKSKYLEYIDSMLKFYIDKEEYEKCKKINVLKDYIEKNM